VCIEGSVAHNQFNVIKFTLSRIILSLNDSDTQRSTQ
jgi:hypothetical protein